MELLIMSGKAFLVGGVICCIGQVLLLKTSITSARILVTYVTAGVFLTAVGLYEPLVKFAGAGATIPLTGFGYALCKGVFKAVDEHGFFGVLTGGLSATAAGVTAAVVFGYLNALIFTPRGKS